MHRRRLLAVLTAVGSIASAGLLSGTHAASVPFSLRIHAGGATVVSSSGHTWEADRDYVGGSTYGVTNAIGGTADPELYKTERWGMSSYRSAVPNGTYNVSLLFAEIWFTAPGKRVFSVDTEGQRVISDLDIFAAVGANYALEKTFPVTVADGYLDLHFVPTVNSAKVSGIRILEATTTSPTPTPTTTPTPTLTSPPPALAGPLPFAMPSEAVRNSSSHMVFAHYFTPYPISEDNLDPSVDYYTRNYLNPLGEGGIHAAYGGLLRDRPMTRAPLGGDWQLTDMEQDVRNARAAGLHGFTVDILGLSGYNWTRLNRLLQAAALVDPSFKIVLMPDATAGDVADPNVLAASVAGIASHSSVFHLADGRLVISPFDPERKGAAWWQSWITTMRVSHGINVAFVPCFLNYWANVDAFAPFSYGFSNWGNRSPGGNGNLAALVNDAHARGKIWMQPVSVQDERPDQYLYTEANNTENLRMTWSAAINDGADWVQIPTWNDYSEGANIAPSEGHGWTFLDISSYYIARYTTGQYPVLQKDALYVTHREQHFATLPSFPEKLPMTLTGSSPARNTVEVLSFLTAPATVTVTVGTQTTVYSAPAGVSAHLVPLTSGQVSAHADRNGGTVSHVVSPYTISLTPYVQDLQYHGVSSLR